MTRSAPAQPDPATQPAAADVPARRWIVSQLGAREDYAVPRALHRRGRLKRLHTEFWCPAPVAALAARLGGRLRPMAGRRHADLADAPVRAYSVATLVDALRTRGGGGGDLHSMATSAAGRAFAERVTDDLRRDPPDPATDAFFGFFTGSLETLRYAASLGVPSVLDQADAGPRHYEIVRGECERWPDWQAPPPPAADAAYWERLAAEWELADVVLVNSEWSRDALAARGVAARKLAVVPLAYDPPARTRVIADPPRGELTVVWMGNVVLGKGIRYLVEAARLLRERPVRFLVAGSIGISAAAVASAPPNVEFLGRVTRDATADVYRRGHLFAFPTLSDGFGLAQLEAMAHGLPVIATPNCGRVVTDGVDGLLVPPADATALAAAVARFDDDRSEVARMSRRAAETCRRYSLDSYARAVEALAPPPPASVRR